jgi:hypothetical protein
VPLSKEKGVDGGLMPDFDRISVNDVSKEYKDNINHILENMQYYKNEKIVRIITCYGEAASFSRALKANGINLERLSTTM